MSRLLRIALLTVAPAHAATVPVKHVFVILLENENADSTFGPGSEAPYLAQNLRGQGQFLPNFYAVTHLSLGNYLALVSGQGSNVETQSDCNVYSEFTPGTIGSDGQAIGQGCVYPTTVKTIADQLSARGLTWKGYMEDMGNTPAEGTTCRHPAIGQQDHTQTAEAGDQYAARHNPFVYFHSIIDSPSCAQNDVPLDRMPADLRSVSTTGNYTFITPNLCHDAHDEPCANKEPGGLVSADAFLRKWIPEIQASPAYRQGGMIVVTFDEAEAGPGGNADSSSCCAQPQFPNTPNNGGPTPGTGGGRIGAVVLSPYVKPGSLNQTAYNHFSFLRSVEDIFGVGHLGYAAQAGLSSFGSDVFNAGPPVLRRLAVRKAVTISYELSQPARVTFSVDRGLLGRRSRGKCRKPTRRTRHRRACRRYKRMRGSLAQSGVQGSNSLGFGGRLRGKRLKAGHYRLHAVASGYSGSSRRATRYFRVKAAKKKKRAKRRRR
jgi:hypothetical protein